MMILKISLSFLLVFTISNGWIVDAIELRTSNGIIRGATVSLGYNNMAHVFKKIPFARPPVGHLRFRRPEPPRNWTQPRDATEYGPSCMSNVTKTYGNHPINISEDCLYLNVFTSERCIQNKTCPILFLVHGGAFVFGNGVQYNDTQILSKYVQHDIVFIIPTYRTGIFGFFDFGVDVDEAPYNVGLYDLVAALNWTHSEIRTFGGDPDELTLMGYSSGATAVQYLMVSPLLQDKGFFSRVMLSSGIPVMKPGLNRQFTEKFLEITKCSKDPHYNLTLSVRRKLTCLRRKSADQLIKDFGRLRYTWSHMGPQSDRQLLPARAYGYLAEKRKSVPLLVITAKDEMPDLFEPNNTMEHLCREHLAAFDFRQNETVAACIRKFGNSSHDLLRSMYHAISVRECQYNSKPGASVMSFKTALLQPGIGLGTMMASEGKPGLGLSSATRNAIGPGIGMSSAELQNSTHAPWQNISEGPSIGWYNGSGDPGIGWTSRNRTDGNRTHENPTYPPPNATRQHDNPQPISGHPCFLGIFAQVNHSNHANDMIYMLGQHKGNMKYTVNDRLMDNYYPNLVRNFVRGNVPTDSWIPTNPAGQNYFYLNFQIDSDNYTAQEWPTLVENRTYDVDSVRFFLEYLPAIEQNASQFHRDHDLNDSRESDSDSNWVGPGWTSFVQTNSLVLQDYNNYTEEEMHHAEEIASYQRLYGLTTLWTVSLLTVFLITVGVMFYTRGGARRRENLQTDGGPLYEPIDEKTRLLG